MGMYDAYRTSPKLETEGVALDLGHLKVLLARAGGANQRYNAALAKINASHGRAIQGNLMPEAKVRGLLYEAYAEFVVLKWWVNTGTDADGETIWTEGIESPDSETLLPFNKENVIATFRALPELFMEFKTFAESITYYRQAILEEVAKNS